MRGPLRTLLCALTVLAAGAAGSARASVVEEASIEALALQSDLVVHGRITARRTVLADAGRRVFTLVTLRVDDDLGTGAAGLLEVVLPGGVHGDLVQQVAGAPLFAPGDEVVLFLDRRPGPAAPDGQPRFTVRGLGLGAFRVRAGVAERQLDGLEVVTGPLDVSRRPELERSIPLTDLAGRVRQARAAARARPEGRRP